jgi:nucleotide-binding universal stress UspA family protein
LAWDYLDQHHLEPNATFDPSYGSEKAKTVLDELVRRAVGDDNEIVRVVVCDHAGHALVEAAGLDASLVVVGARGMSGFKGLLLGSVSRHLLHAATCPVAIVRDNASRVDEPVVVGIDGSEPSRRALQWAIDYARSRQLNVIALHAWILPFTMLGVFSPPDLGECAERADQFLENELRRVDPIGLIDPIERRAVEGRPSAALLEASSLASLVVVGSRGRGEFTNTLLGSVSDQVSHYATCPVVVVP